MKTLEELAGTITTTSIADLVPKIILDEVEEAARARRFGRELVKINEDLVKTKGRSIVVGRRGTAKAVDVGEGETMQSQEITYTSNTITPTKKSVAVHITQESIDGAELNLIRDTVTEAGIALAEKEDSDIIKALLSFTADSATLSTAGATLNIASPLVYVDETAYTGSTIDYMQGLIVSAGAQTIDVYTTDLDEKYLVDSLANGNTWSADAYKSIADAVTKVKGRKWSPKFLVIHTDALGGLLKSGMFIDASKYGINEPILNGEIGKISGLKVLATTQMPQGAALVVDNDRAAWMAVKRKVDMKRWDNPSSDSIELYFYTEYGIKTTDVNAMQVILNITDKSVAIASSA